MFELRLHDRSLGRTTRLLVRTRPRKQRARRFYKETRSSYFRRKNLQPHVLEKMIEAMKYSRDYSFLFGDDDCLKSRCIAPIPNAAMTKKTFSL
ncbi:hypothetical protein MLD38_006532 [Melastoma candidum]|uniref:Uncharacterized protein n=1 Tax=Melastoma candidum TaxID=119954 RepID=A0ACB9RSC9_9MYRT|nr:hypothetical protein MLD38_006532 [Melastoma candidum]